MLLRIGDNSNTINKGIVAVVFKDVQQALVIDAEKTKFVYLNPDEVKSVSASEE